MALDDLTLREFKMKTVQIDLYKFNELSDDVQTQVVENYTESLNYFDDGVIEDVTDLLAHLGFSDIEIEYSLDYSHVPFAKLFGKFSKQDLTFAKTNYKSFKNVSQIINLIESYDDGECHIDDSLEYQNMGAVLCNIVDLVNAMIFEMIESDYINYFSN